MRRASRIVVCCLSLGLCAGGFTTAVETQRWSASAEELLRGRADGIAVSLAGRLSLAPRIQRLDDALAGTGALATWSACEGAAGEIFLGTGPDGLIVRADGNGAGRVFFRTGETMVTALIRLSGGDLLAGTSPGGKVYRIDAQGRGELWVETGERYVWALAESDGGNIFAATGEHGKVLRLRSDGSVETHFDSDEPHIVALLHDRAGALMAGGAGIGRLYSIDAEGNGLVLYDDELIEVRAIARSEAGTWSFALVGAAESGTRRPELRLRLPDGVTIEPDLPLEEREGSTLSGFIEGLEEDTGRVRKSVRGRLVRIDADDLATVLWQSTRETPLSLANDASGRLLMGTGDPGRLYRVEPDDDVALLATLSEAHLTALLRVDRTVFAGTGNPAALWRVEAVEAEQGAYVSPAHDAGHLTRWGSISWSPRGRLARTEVYTRTGNSPTPDVTWSGWSPAQVLADGSPVDNPDGRFAQFRVRFIGSQERDARLSDVTLHYEPYNRPPRLESGPTNVVRAVSGTARFPWKARDPDGDPLEAVLEYRATFSGEWQTAPRDGTITDGSKRTPAVQSGAAAWNTEDLPEGLYDIRLSVGDDAANDDAEAGWARAPVRQVAVDRTPPTLEARRLAGGRVEVVVTDEATHVGRLTLLRDGRPVARPRSADGVCDSRRERFEFDAPAGAGIWKVRGVDLAGNTAEAVLPAE